MVGSFNHTPQEPTPQRDSRIMLRIRAQGQEARDEDRIGEAGREAKKLKQDALEELLDTMWETGETWAEIEEKKRRQ